MSQAQSRPVAGVLILKRGPKPPNDSWYMEQVVKTLCPEAFHSPGVKIRARWATGPIDVLAATFMAKDELGEEVLDSTKFEPFTQTFNDADGDGGMLFIVYKQIGTQNDAGLSHLGSRPEPDTRTDTRDSWKQKHREERVRRRKERLRRKDTPQPPNQPQSSSTNKKWWQFWR